MEKSPRPKSALLCSMCTHILVNSYKLPCGHTFCFNCLKNSDKIIDNKIACYSCNERFTIPAQGILGFESVSGAELLRERLYSKLNDDKKDKFYASDPNLASPKTSSERPKSSSYASKMQEDPVYQRYAKYSQPETTPTTVRYVKRARKSPTRHSSNLSARLKNLNHKADAEKIEPKSMLSDILSKRSSERLARERPKTSYEFPHHSQIPEDVQRGERLDDVSSSPSASITRDNIRGRTSFKNFPTGNKINDDDDTFQSRLNFLNGGRNEFKYSDSNLNYSSASPKINYSHDAKPAWTNTPHTTQGPHTCFGRSQHTPSHDYKSDSNKNENTGTKGKESRTFSYSREKSDFQEDKIADEAKEEDVEKERQKGDRVNKSSFSQSDKLSEDGDKMKTFRSKVQRELPERPTTTSFLRGGQSGVFNIHTSPKSFSSEHLSGSRHKSKGKNYEVDEQEHVTRRTSRNFLDRFNDADLFNSRVLRMRISRTRYEKIMRDEELDEALLLSEDEKEEVEEVREGAGGKADADGKREDEENVENIDPNVNAGSGRERKTKSQLTDEELKVNGRSLKDVITAARQKYAVYMQEEEEEEEREKEEDVGEREREEEKDEGENGLEEAQNEEVLEEENINQNANHVEENERKTELQEIKFAKSKKKRKLDFDEKIRELEVMNREGKLREKPAMVLSEGVVLEWRVEREDFGIPTSALVLQDVVVVADYGRSCLDYYDIRGNFEHQIEGVKPFCLAASKGDKMFVGDRRSKSVRVFDKFGSDVEQWEKTSVEWMSGIGVLSSGRLCVLDRSRCKVSVVSADGEIHTEFGSYGSNKHQLCMADFLAVDGNDRIIIADSGNHCIKVFDSDGKFVGKFGEKGSEDGQLSWPKGVTVDSANNIIVTDSNNNRVSIFSPDGVFLRHLIRNITSPYNLHFDPSQNLLAVTGYLLSGTSFCSLFSISP